MLNRIRIFLVFLVVLIACFSSSPRIAQSDVLCCTQSDMCLDIVYQDYATRKCCNSSTYLTWTWARYYQDVDCNYVASINDCPVLTAPCDTVLPAFYQADSTNKVTRLAFCYFRNSVPVGCGPKVQWKAVSSYYQQTCSTTACNTNYCPCN